MSGQVRHECNDESYYALFVNSIYVGDIYDESKIEHIVKAVNAYDSLAAENERLRKDLDTANACITALDARAEEAEAEVERLRTEFVKLLEHFGIEKPDYDV
jgi:hypothetical protein